MIYDYRQSVWKEFYIPGKCCLTPDATDYAKEQFELHMNCGFAPDTYKMQYPEMRNPYYTWEGKIVDKPLTPEEEEAERKKKKKEKFLRQYREWLKSQEGNAEEKP